MVIVIKCSARISRNVMARPDGVRERAWFMCRYLERPMHCCVCAIWGFVSSLIVDGGFVFMILDNRYRIRNCLIVFIEVIRIYKWLMIRFNICWNN